MNVSVIMNAIGWIVTVWGDQVQYILYILR